MLMPHERRAQSLARCDTTRSVPPPCREDTTIIALSTAPRHHQGLRGPGLARRLSCAHARQHVLAEEEHLVELRPARDDELRVRPPARTPGWPTPGRRHRPRGDCGRPVRAHDTGPQPGGQPLLVRQGVHRPYRHRIAAGQEAALHRRGRRTAPPPTRRGRAPRRRPRPGSAAPHREPQADVAPARDHRLRIGGHPVRRVREAHPARAARHAQGPGRGRSPPAM